MANSNTVSPTKDDFIFEYGDLEIKLKLDGNEIIGKVSASAMAMASPVWKKFIYPPFPQVESDESAGHLPVKELDFTEDDPTALLILLRVAHLRFNLVPASPQYEQLVKLAILCDQYDCVDLVKPWFNTWFLNEVSEALKDGQEKWLLIAWVFGRENCLDSLALKLVRELALDKDGKADFGIKDLDSLPIPQSLIENILKVRIDTIERLLEIPYKCIDRYEGTEVVYCKGSADRTACDAISYGCILKNVQRANIWPRPNVGGIRISASQLASSIKAFDCLWLANHGKCLGMDDMKLSATEVLANIETPVPHSLKERLRAVNKEEN